MASATVPHGRICGFLDPSFWIITCNFLLHVPLPGYLNMIQQNNLMKVLIVWHWSNCLLWICAALTRSWVCTLQLLLGIASAAFLRSESHETHKHILLSLFLRLPQPGGPGSCIYFPQEQGSTLIPPGIGLWTISRSQSHITTDSQSARPSWCQAPF
jgi:hypothetical protein